jgi:hypothetical protein
MHIDRARHRAAQAWIDALVSYDDTTELDGSEDATLLALNPLSIDLASDTNVAAARSRRPSICCPS